MRSLDMFPGIASLNLIDEPTGDRKVSGDSRARLSIRQTPLNETDLRLIQHRARVISPGVISHPPAPLCHLVGHIIRLRSLSQMVRINARRGVARMHNDMPRRYFSVGEAIRNAVGIVPGLMFDRKLAVASLQPTAEPKPACAGATRPVNFRPEPGRIGIKHRNLHSGGPVGAPTPRLASCISTNFSTKVLQGALWPI